MSTRPKVRSKVVQKVRDKIDTSTYQFPAGGGLALGPELITNGDMTTDLTGWNATSMLWQAPGHAVARNITNATLQQDVATLLDEPMRLEFEYSIQSGGLIYIRLGNVNLETINGPSSGTYLGFLQVQQAGSISMLMGGAEFDVDYLDNVSLREVLTAP